MVEMVVVDYDGRDGGGDGGGGGDDGGGDGGGGDGGGGGGGSGGSGGVCVCVWYYGNFGGLVVQYLILPDPIQ